MAACWSLPGFLIQFENIKHKLVVAVALVFYCTVFHETETLRSVSLFHNGKVGNDADFDAHLVTSKDHVGHFKAADAIDTDIGGFASRQQILLQLPENIQFY